MTDADCHWLAGLIDGEGCFTVAYNGPPRKAGGRYFQPRLALGVRADDDLGIREIQARTGIGHVRTSKAMERSPVVTWSVESKADCLALVHILDRTRLRLKKGRDYELWRAAVFEWQKDDCDREFMQMIREQIMAGRKYA